MSSPITNPSQVLVAAMMTGMTMEMMKWAICQMLMSVSSFNGIPL